MNFLSQAVDSDPKHTAAFGAMPAMCGVYEFDSRSIFFVS